MKLPEASWMPSKFKDSEQKFIQFTRTGLNAGKYAGVIKTKDEIINIYPKIFKSEKINFNFGNFENELWRS